MRTLLVLCVLVASRADAGGIGDRALERTRSSLLDDHLKIQLPVGMVLEPGQGATDRFDSPADQTLAALDVDDGRFVMTAHATYQRAGTDLRASVAQEMQRQGGALTRARVETLEIPSGIAAVAVRPPLPRTGSDPNLVLAVYVASADDTVQMLGFYVTGMARGHAREWAELAERTALTLTAGTGTLHGYTGLLGLGLRRVRISCRDDCVIRISTRGYQLRTLAPIGHTQMCTFEDGAVSTRTRRAQRAGRVLGSRVGWEEWGDGDGLHTRASVAIPGSGRPVQITCDATIRAELDALRAKIEGMTLDDPHAAPD